MNYARQPEQLGQSLLFANALDVVKSTDKDPKAGQILTMYLNMAKKDIEALGNERYNQDSATDGNTTRGMKKGGDISYQLISW